MSQPFALVIGAGPAGLMAAEMLSARGHRVVLAEAKPSPARKFLMAGKSGLNLTKDEPVAQVIDTIASPWLAPILQAFGPDKVMDWARGLGQEVFTGSSGRVFPTVMKGSPLLRAWLARLQDQGVILHRGWRWQALDQGDWQFSTAEGLQNLRPDAVVLGLGGASWARLGSDGAWVPLLEKAGVEIAPWAPANMGLFVDWSPYMARHFGQPIKGAALRAGDLRSRGEFVISAQGLEGGGIYPLSPALRKGLALEVDLMPQLSALELSQRLSRLRASESSANRMRKLGLSPAAIALVMEWAKGDINQLKALRLQHHQPRPLDEAISVAGGITKNSFDADLALKALPGTFVCGEMLDWEAPTGGYLLTACLATGRHAGLAAAQYLSDR